MSERGVFAVDRGLFEHPLFADEPFSEREAWLWLLSEAAWRVRERRIAGRVVKLQRGQLAASFRFMAERWHWSLGSVQRFIKKLLDADTMIKTASDTGVLVITICNYARYQRVKLPDDTEGDTETDTGPIQDRYNTKTDKPIEEENNNIARGPHRLPANWRLSAADREFARELGWTEAEIDDGEIEFVDYWSNPKLPASRAVKRNWSVAWRNRVRDMGNRRGAGRSRGPPPSRPSVGIAAFAAVGRKAQENLDRRNGLFPDSPQTERSPGADVTRTGPGGAAGEQRFGGDSGGLATPRSFGPRLAFG
jgi:hypothetical protein